jgi:hypothetical protein
MTIMACRINSMHINTLLPVSLLLCLPAGRA